ncbi:hypothetical protein BCR35DRAFT_302881 [Leucosporidium creatinivorum]|uniref:ER membrane protein complex subunit 10 n=1 Tax=Leucosporidium creatinivorum TaxID=106004 RepID=A0A1Y2FN97_9BASI|nr:hypothetical protein BCR35DRAFT_302881 [Leucosporidium creatinivorum]
MLPSLLSVSLLGLVSLVAASDDARLSTQSLPLYHRLVSFSSEAAAPEWVLRGLVHVDTIQDEAWLEETGKGVEELVSPAWLAGGANQDEQLQEEKYQIVLGEPEEERRQIIAVDSCILLHPPSSSFLEHLTLVYNSAPAAPQLTGFRYTTAGKGSRAACVKGASREQAERGAGALGGEITVKVDRGTAPEPVHFRAPEAAAGGKPVTVGEDGKIIPPPPEKSFIQKNWPYLLPIVVILLMGGGGEEPAAAPKK